MPETERRKAAEELLPPEVKALRDKADDFWGAWVAKKMGNKSEVRYSVSEFAADFALAERDSALLEAAGLVCNSCKNGRPIVKEVEYWVHPERKDHTEPFMCAAHKIHERRALKGNG